ncbi:MAG TPA: transposase [Thermoanaerobaculia bacterium]|nr:transposase [Thermoanaerobaculia bacterium]
MIIGRRSHRRHLPHFQSDYRTYFVTYVTLERVVLPHEARDIARRHIIERRSMYFLHVAIVMPDHVHLILTPGWDASGHCYSLSEILRRIKGASAREINLLLGCRGALWLDESFDHELRRDEDLRKKAEYVCNNPVRRGLVSTPDEYRWLWRSWIEGNVGQASACPSWNENGTG